MTTTQQDLIKMYEEMIASKQQRIKDLYNRCENGYLSLERLSKLVSRCNRNIECSKSLIRINKYQFNNTIFSTNI